MELYQKFQVVQFCIILITCIIGLRLFREETSPERKFILPFCFIDLVTTGIIVFNHIKGEFLINRFTTLLILFSWAEIYFIPKYIGYVIEKKPKITTQLILFFLPPILSNIIFNDLTLLSMLLSVIYISFYNYKYLIWLFLNKRTITLEEIRHAWIIMGIIISYTASIPYWLSDILFHANGNQPTISSINKVLFAIYVLLNIIMYLFFIKAFLCKSKQVELSSGQLQAQ